MKNINILLVSDNRIFIRQIYSSLNSDSDLIINVIFHSTQIFEAYLKYRPDIILLDGLVYLPITSILKHFNEYHWDCPFLITAPVQTDFSAFHNVTLVNPEQDNLKNIILSQRKVYEHTDQSDSSPYSLMSDDGQYLPESDLYYVMFSVFLSTKEPTLSKDIIDKSKKKCSAIGKIEIFRLLKNGILIIMRNTTMNQYKHFSQIHTILTQATSLAYTSIYCTRISLSEISYISHQLVHLAPLSYCLGSSCLSLTQLQYMQTTTAKIDVYATWSELLRFFFKRDIDALLSTLRYFYLHQVIGSADISSLQYLRLYTAFSEQYLFKNYVETPIGQYYPFTCAQKEYERVQQYWKDLLHNYQKEPFLLITEESILRILNQYNEPDWSLDAAANELGYSKAHISRTFKRNLGITFHELLQQLRLLRSTHLLTASDSSISEIALAVGYTDAQYFSKVFHRNLKLYPSDYRKLHTKEACYASTYPTQK